MNRPLPWSAALVLLAAAAAFAAASRAHAEPTASTAECFHSPDWGTDRAAAKAAEWMNGQLAAGHTRFVPFGDGTLCAW